MISDRRFGILGGMGAIATAAFYDRMIKHCLALGARTDQDFPEIAIYSLSPEGMNETGIVNERAVLRSVGRGIAALNMLQVNCILIACNTVHLYLDKIQLWSKAVVLNMVQETIKALSAATYGVMCSKTSAEHHLYGDAIYPEEEHQNALEVVISRVICGEHSYLDSLRVQEVAQRLYDRGAQTVIVGCTELSVVAGASENLIDPVDIIIRKALAL